MNEERNNKQFHFQIIPFPKIILSKRNGIIPSGSASAVWNEIQKASLLIQQNSIMPSGINFKIGLNFTLPWYKTESIDAAYSGCNGLIAIFVKSIDTASKGGSGAK